MAFSSFRLPQAVRARRRQRPGPPTRLSLECLEDRTLLSAGIQGSLFHDRNGDGARGPGEPALAGVTVYLDQNHNGTRDSGEASTSTDAAGAYQFSGLADGTYTVAQEVPAGWAQTSPGPVTGPGLLGR